MDVCGLRAGFRLRGYQKPIVEEALKEFEGKSRQNIFISLPQGTGKTGHSREVRCRSGEGLPGMGWVPGQGSGCTRRRGC